MDLAEDGGCIVFWQRGKRVINSSSGEPIEGQSHWCDGWNRQAFPGNGWRFRLPCGNIVRNDSDHCEAGHKNKIRTQPSANINQADIVSDHVSLDIDDLADTKAEALIKGMSANDRVAKIGDSDLDFDVIAIMRPVFRHDSPDLVELAIECEGGIGGWDNDDSSIDDMGRVDTVSIGVTYHAFPEKQIEHRATMIMIDRIIRWGEARAVVRIVCAPDKLSTIYGPDDQVALLPRSKPGEQPPVTTPDEFARLIGTVTDDDEKTM
jgi:hypothetical protein